MTRHWFVTERSKYPRYLLRSCLVLLLTCLLLTVVRPGSNVVSAQKTQRTTSDSLKKKLAGTKWINSNNVSFEWTTDGRFLHKGIEREWKVLDGNGVQIVFGPDHKDTLVFNDAFTQFKQLIKGGSASMQGRLVASKTIKSREADYPRISNRTFPSVFEAWASADNLPSEDKLATLARHDLVWNLPPFYGLQWNRSPIGLANDFTPESIETGLAKRKEILSRNPNMILLAEIRYRDARKDYLPENHGWWMRDKQGKLVMGWAEGGFIRLKLKSPQFRKQVATQCRAAVKSGVVDGVMLDWWDDDDDRLALVKEVRKAIGEDALIITNPNDRTTPRTAPYINGYFMECYRSKTVEDWKRIADTLTWAETNLRLPRINCVESWYHKSRQDLNLMRAVTTLVLTHSDGYCLFSDPNGLPTPDHLHDWYPFWDKSLGKPSGTGKKQKDGSTIREFELGMVVYNPMGNRSVTISFAQPRKSLATGNTAMQHQVNPADGDIFLLTK